MKTKPNCKCTFAQSIVGDGCDICNPEKAAELIKDDAHPGMRFFCTECGEPTPEYLRYQDGDICTGCGNCA